jgi:adenine-specific DNA methylase
MIKKIGESNNFGEMFEIDDHFVRIFKRPGRTIITCDCENGTRFCNEPTLCRHKEITITWRSIKRINGVEEANEFIKEWESQTNRRKR